jgi:hypothetical protein
MIEKLGFQRRNIIIPRYWRREYAFQDTATTLITSIASPGQLVNAGLSRSVTVYEDSIIRIIAKTRWFHAATVATAITQCVSEIYNVTGGVTLDTSDVDLRYDTATATLRMRRATVTNICDVTQAANTTIVYRYLQYASAASNASVRDVYLTIDVCRS